MITTKKKLWQNKFLERDVTEFISKLPRKLNLLIIYGF